MNKDWIFFEGGGAQALWSDQAKIMTFVRLGGFASQRNPKRFKLHSGIHPVMHTPDGDKLHSPD